MDVIRDIRTNYKDFLARLFIDFLLLWMRFVDRICRTKSGSGLTAATKREPSTNKLQTKEESKLKTNKKQTEDVTERSSRQLEGTEQNELDSGFGRTEEEEMHWLRNERQSLNYSERSLEEVDSSMLESTTHDLQQQISALSDYYSDDEELANRWTTAKRDESIAESLAIAEDLGHGTSDFVQARSAYRSFCEGLDRLRDDFKEILEKWKKRNDESTGGDLGGSVSVNRRRTNPWNRSADGTVNWRGSDSSVLHGSLDLRSTARLSESLGERSRFSLDQHRQILLTHEHLMQQRSDLNHRMSREYNKTKELLVLMEKKKIELCAKVNDQEWRSLSQSCDVLYEQQPKLRGHCHRLTRNMVDRRQAVLDGVRILRTAVEGLDNCLTDESMTLKVWSEKKTSKLNQIELVASKLKKQFDERKAILTELECNSYLTKSTECLQLHTATSAQLLDDWNAVSCSAKVILKQKYLDTDEHEERCFEWKDFSEVDEFREDYERHLEAFQEYVPRICQIHERRSPGSTGIFGLKPERVEFDQFYQSYRQKMNAIGEDYSHLESSLLRCRDDIEYYRDLYDVVLGLTEKQRKVDEVLREEESTIRVAQGKLKEFRDSVHLHLMGNQEKRLTGERRQIVEILKRIEKQVNESNQMIEMFANSLTATRNFIQEIEKAQVLRRHFERLVSLAADWETRKSYEKLFDLISQIENFQATENPHRLDFKVHEERVNYLEKRLPKIVALHERNYSTYLQKWLACSLEYDECEKEPLSFAEISNQNETWPSEFERISLVLDSLKKESAGRLQQLLQVDAALSQLNAPGYDLHCSESLMSFKESFDVHFRQAEAGCRNFRQILTDFRPVYGQYFELKTAHHRVMETLDKERYSSDKLTEKLENCKGLLRGHRDHLERRRIRIKIEELLASIKEVLSEKVKECESQVKRLEVESELLIHKFVDLSGQHFSDITHLQIPNLEGFFISLDNFEQNLNGSEDKLGKCVQTLIKEEKTVHEYWTSVQHLTAFIAHAAEATKVFKAKLEAGEKLLNVCTSFIENYTKQEKCFDIHLHVSNRKLVAFIDAYKYTESEANDLNQLFQWYCLNFAGDMSGDSFRATCNGQLTEISATVKDHRTRLLEAQHSIRTKEAEVGKRLEDGKRDKVGITQKLEVSSKDISDQSELQKRCISLLNVILEKKKERESKAAVFKKRLQDENYEEHCKVYRPNIIENEELFDCPLCSKRTQPHDGIILRECLHRFCKKCLETHIKDSKSSVVACPRSTDQKTRCFGIVLDKEIQSFGGDVGKLCAERSLSEYRDENRFVLTCGSCDRLIADDGQPRCQKPFFRCPYCEKKNCRRCKVVHEGNETCEEYDLTLPYRKIVESLKCRLCMERDVQVAFIPCGHVVCCEECVKRLKDVKDSPPACPICKSVYHRAMKIYLQTNDEKPDKHLKMSHRN